MELISVPSNEMGRSLMCSTDKSNLHRATSYGKLEEK
jgi:hypothetical protein